MLKLLFGLALHDTIQHWLVLLYTSTIKKATNFDFKAFLLDRIKIEYASRIAKHGTHFSNPEELASYYQEGLQILEYLIKKRSIYFSKKRCKLISIELPILTEILESHPTVKFMGFVDVILYDEDDKTFIIIDLKTSTRGWNDYKKKDVLTTDQLVLYKYCLAKQFSIDIDKIELLYFILKRKINTDSLWPQKRIQEFKPSAGSVSINRVKKNLEKYVSECFNPDGTYKLDRNYPAISGTGSRNCMFCPYNTEQYCPSKFRIDEK